MAFLGIFGLFLVGVGVLLIGCAAIWWVSIYDKQTKGKP